MSEALTSEKRSELAESLAMIMSAVLSNKGVIVNDMMSQTIVAASKLVASRAVLKESE
jgi:hypothetical protein